MTSPRELRGTQQPPLIPAVSCRAGRTGLLIFELGHQKRFLLNWKTQPSGVPSNGKSIASSVAAECAVDGQLLHLQLLRAANVVKRYAGVVVRDQPLNTRLDGSQHLPDIRIGQ
jgi:hypothetical protein